MSSTGSLMRWIPGGVTAARGFSACGISAGIKRARTPDLALVVADRAVTAAGVLTRNRITAAPVDISRARLRRGRARAVLINSGCANCLTGPQGLRDALALSRSAASALGIAERDVLVASTGVIGRRLPVSRIQRAIPALVQGLSHARHAEAARAILTTDRAIKEAAVEAVIGGRRCRLGGMAKGAGMIAPSMATMLCVLTTDVRIAPALLRAWLRWATARTFNRISVDGDMSTNDTVFALAGGASGVTISPGTMGERIFARMLEAVTAKLAALIVEDGEGASRVMEVAVVGARSEREADRCARQVANSPLVKTMLAGGDPNVGRVAAAVGAAQVRGDPRRLEILLGGRRVVGRGAAIPAAKGILRRLMQEPVVKLRIRLHAGRSAARMLTCDLTEGYVRINGRYLA